MDQGCSVTKIDEHRVARFGGSEMLRYDVSIFDIDTLCWSEIPIQKGQPHPLGRQYSTTVCLGCGGDSPQLLVIGGDGYGDASQHHDLWRLDINSALWEEIRLPNADEHELWSGYSYGGYAAAHTPSPGLTRVVTFWGKTNVLIFGVQSLRDLSISVIKSALQEQKSLEPTQLNSRLPDYVPTAIRQAISDSLRPPFPEILVSRQLCPRLVIPDNAPWVQLATRLAKLACASVPPTSIQLSLCGDKMKPLGEFLKPAVLDGVSLACNLDIRASTKVYLTTSPKGCNCVKVDCGGVRLSGTVLETVPVLVGVNGAECGMVTLCGNILLTKGLTIEYLAQTIQGIREVSVWGDYMITKVTALPTAPVQDCIAAISL